MTYRLSESEAGRLLHQFTLSEIEWLCGRYEGRTEGMELADLYRELARYGYVDSATRAAVPHSYFKL
jgi:hypothetical protein